MLSDEDLAYMRETQAEARPTEAELLRRTQGATASGGRGDSYADPEPIAVRLDGKPQDVPAAVTAVMGGGKPVKITMDLVEVRSGDQITVGGYTYQVVTDGDPGEWTTAQIVWAKQVRAPARA